MYVHPTEQTAHCKFIASLIQTNVLWMHSTSEYIPWWLLPATNFIISGIEIIVRLLYFFSRKAFGLERDFSNDTGQYNMFI